jgi:cytochrome c553
LDLESFSDANAPLLPSQFENKLEFNVDDAIEAMQQLGDDDAWTAAAVGAPALLNPAEMNSAIAMQTIASDSVTNHQPFCSTAASVTANVNALSQTQTLSNSIANQPHHSTVMSQATNGLIPGSILGLIPGSEARDFGAELPCNSILPSQPTSTSQQKSAIAKVTYSTLSQKCSDLASVASKAPQDTAQFIQGAIIALTRVARGEHSGLEAEKCLIDIVSEADQAINRRGFHATYPSVKSAGFTESFKNQYPASMGHSVNAMPVSARVPRSGPAIKRRFASAVMNAHTTGSAKPSSRSSSKARCSFCHQDDGHKITACPAKKSIGTHLFLNEIDSLMNRLITGHGIKELPDGIVTLEKPVLDSVPPKTQWLVVHGMHYLNNNPHPESFKTSPLNYSVLVTSLGIRGNALDKDQYSRCIIRQNAVTTWIGEKHKSRVRAQGLSKVFTSPDFLL